MELFADNAKYLFLETVRNRPDIAATWLAKDRKLASLLRARGYDAHYQYGLRGIYAALRAGTTVVDAFLQPENFRLCGRTRLVQLLHGKGMKKGGYNLKPPRRQDYIFAPSPYVRDMLPAVFVEQAPVVIAGYPRNDIFFRDIADSDIGVDTKTAELLRDKRYRKRFLYAPTFRRGQKRVDLEATLDLVSLSKWLASESNLLCISLHPKYRDQVRSLSYPHIHFVEDCDIYPLLRDVDVLINDYSSLFSDFLLLDRPIIFYPYDLAAYKKNEGLTYENYDDYTPGPKVYTPQELLTAMIDVSTTDVYATERARVRNLYHAHQDGQSGLRILSKLTINT